MNEFATAEDLARAFGFWVPRGITTHFEKRRAMSRGTWWLAMALDHIGAATMLRADETVPFMLKRTAGDPSKERWLTAVHGFVHSRITSRWKQLDLQGAPIGGHKHNDSIIVSDAAWRRIPVITRDHGLIKKAQDQGVQAVAPEAFAAPIISLQRARRVFFERFEEHAASWSLRTRPGGIDWVATGKQCDGLRWAHAIFELIWRDELVVGTWTSDHGIGQTPELSGVAT